MTGQRPSITAETLHIDDLVSRALRGRIRVPPFQRGLRWRDDDVQRLFDSIHRGFPIGSLLMWKRPAKAERVAFGPVEVDAEATEDAWWVLDGQQRLTSLVAGLRHPDPADPDDPFVVFYDLHATPGQSLFFRPHGLRRASPYCIPLARCFDAADLQQWLVDFVNATGGRPLIARASEVATRIRNYRVPVYVVDTDDVDVAREIFVRTNLAGRRMEAYEVFAGLAPGDARVGQGPGAIAERLSALLGAFDPKVVMLAANALVSDDVTAGDARLDVRDRARCMRDTEVALDAALRFLRDCRVPHTRLLPAVVTPLVTLARFFAKHPGPSDRSRRLLRRWLWRGFFGGALGSDAKILRRAVVAVTDDEDASVQALLAQVPRVVDDTLALELDARDSISRLAGLVLALQHPAPPAVDLGRCAGEGTDEGDVFEWLDLWGDSVFTALSGVKDGPAWHFLTPGLTGPQLRDQLRAWAAERLDHPALASHLVPPEAARALLHADDDAFVSLRARAIEGAARSLHVAMGEPTHDDRPPLVMDGAA